jgi:RNA polymerase sigma factor (sigma-70 family)
LTFLHDISNPVEGDQELVSSYQQTKDLAILGALYQRYMDLVFGLCLKYLGEPEMAKDAVMNIFEELAQKLLKHQVTHFKGWLYTVSRNHCLMQLRSFKGIKTSELDPDRMQMAGDLHLNAVWEKEGQLDKLSKCMGALSPEQKEAIELFYLQNRSYKEIESMTGLDGNRVRSHIQNGRRNLKTCMEKNEWPIADKQR